ncbi:MAG: autotransporter-associated beta strand repeat-containing protein, partial [Planctomycetes bacterium]|nr:autotransporter-associated beta strand repeat-containing protein [Planctomycetota bacterium]
MARKACWGAVHHRIVGSKRSFRFSDSRHSNTHLMARLAILCIVTVGTLSPTLASAATFTWTATGSGSGSWSDTTKWSGGNVADATDAVADFSTIDITSARTITINPNTFTIGTLIVGDAGGTLFDTTFSTGAGTLSLAVSSGAPEIQIVNATTTITSLLSGTQGFKKTGAGTLSISAANVGLSGTVTVSAGTLQIALSDSVLGTGAVTLGDSNNNASLLLASSGRTITNAITVSGSGTMTLGVTGAQANATYSGNITLNNNLTA